MRLTVEEHPEAIKRYAHVKRGRGAKTRPCADPCPGTKRSCTLETGHRGPHVAHGSFGRVTAVWDSGRPRPETSRSPARGGSRPKQSPKRPIGLRSERPTGIIERLRDGIRTIGSLEEIVFFVFFLAFVGFAIHWLLLIM